MDGLYEGPSYLLIEKEGYRPGGVRARAGQTDLLVTLIDAGQPRADTGSASPAKDSPSAEEQAVARRTLEELWALHGQIAKRPSSNGRLFAGGFRTGELDLNLARLMARINPDMALDWSAGKDDRFRTLLRAEIVRAGKAAGVEPAVASDDEAGLPQLMAKSRRALSDGDREEAIKKLKTAWRFVEQNREALAESRGDLIWAAKIGALAVAAGDEEWGRQLVKEAADQLEKPDGDGAPLATLAEVAIALAQVDHDRAVRIWESLPQPPSKERLLFAQYAVRLAIALAPHDIEAARRVAASQEYLQPDWAMIEVACRLGGTHPDKAVQIVEELSSEWQQVGAFERLAVSVAQRDQARGFDLIDRALAICGPRSSGQSRLDLSDVAGPLALAALEIGYPDMVSVVDRVLAARITADDRSTAPGRAASTINFARLLALIDREVARELLSVIPRPADAIDTAAGDASMAQWLQAWALLDLGRAERLFKEVLAEQRPRLTSECVQSCLLPMIDLLTTPPAGRAALVAAEHNERYRAFPFSLPDD